MAPISSSQESARSYARPGVAAGEPVEAPRMAYQDHTGELHVNFHAGQMRAWESDARMILVLAGTQGGKTSWGPYWLAREIQARGPGDYLVVAPTFKLLSLKLFPEFIRLFVTIGKWGDFTGRASFQSRYLFNEYGCRCFFGRVPTEQTQIFFAHAQDPDAVESATAKAAWLDEAGQRKFRLGTWEAIQRRLSIHQGRVLITTTPYCYDEQTEVYTRRGWKTFGNLLPDDEVLACDTVGKAHFEIPQARVWEPYEGPMVRMIGGRVDLLVTPNHRMLYYNGRPYVDTAENFVQKRYRFLSLLKTVDVQTEPVEWFELPPVQKYHRWGKATGRLRSVPVRVRMRDWCAFLGWFLSEGSVHGSRGGLVRNGEYTVSICQTRKNAERRRIIRDDLSKLPFRWYEDDVGFHTNNKQLWHYCKQLGNSHTKYIPANIKHSGKDNLRVLVDRMLLGDGSYSTRYKPMPSNALVAAGLRAPGGTYYTCNRRLAEDFQEVCMLLGVSSNIRELTNKGGVIDGRRIVTGDNTIHHVEMRSRSSGMVREHATVPYKGMIGCVSVSTGFVLVRRGGEELVCGNTLGWLKDLLYDPWKRCKEGKCGHPGADDRDEHGRRIHRHPYIDVVNFRSIENPAFPREEYERTKTVLPAWKHRMFYDGIFDRPAGAIFEDFDPNIHVIDPIPLPDEWPRWVGLDFGGVHTAGVFVAEELRPADSYPTKDEWGRPQDPPSVERRKTGRLFVYREYPERSQWASMTAKAHVERIKKGEVKLPGAVGGSHSEGQWREEFRAGGLFVHEPPIKDVEVGINRIIKAIKANELLVFRNCIGLIDQMQNYSRVLDESGEPTEDIDDKEEYHYCDALRYIVARLKGVSQTYWLR